MPPLLRLRGAAEGGARGGGHGGRRRGDRGYRLARQGAERGVVAVLGGGAADSGIAVSRHWVSPLVVRGKLPLVAPICGGAQDRPNSVELSCAPPYMCALPQL